MRGEISRAEPWKVMVDLFIYREPEDLEKDKVASVNAALPPPVVWLTVGKRSSYAPSLTDS